MKNNRCILSILTNVKAIKQVLIITLLFIISIVLFSIRFLYNTINNSSEVTNVNDNQVFKSLDYQNTSFVSEYLNIKIDLKDYRLLSNQEMIDYLNLDNDYYDEDLVKEHIDNGESFCELMAISNDKSSISIIISKPKLLSSIKDLMSLYNEEEIEKLINDYKTKGFSNISLKPYASEFLGEERFIFDVSYFDRDNNPMYIRDIYINNKPYQGIIRLIGDGINNLDLMKERLSIHETKN